MPPNRHAFLVELAKAGKVTAAEASLKPFGLAPYAIQEWGEMLTGAFRRWRVLPEDTPLDRIRKRQHEQSILFMAGVLAHRSRTFIHRSPARTRRLVAGIRSLHRSL